MTGAAKLGNRDVAEAVAAALTAIDEHPWATSTHPSGMLLTATDGTALRVRIARHGPESGRLLVVCEPPPDARDVPSADALTARATVDPTRPTARIAADLHRRLVTPYRHARPAARDWRRAADALAAAEQAILAEVRSNLSGLPTLVSRGEHGDRGALRLCSELPHTGPIDLVQVVEPSLRHEIRAGQFDAQFPSYTEVRLRVHPRLLPDLSRALAVLGWASDITSVPAHQCPHAHEPQCRHGHDHTDHRDPEVLIGRTGRLAGKHEVGGADMITVRVESTYSCGHASEHAAVIRAPHVGESAEGWFDDVVQPETGDGHSCGPSEHAHYEALVTVAPRRPDLLGQSRTWEG